MSLRVHTETGTPAPPELGLVTIRSPPVTSTEPEETIGGFPVGVSTSAKRPMVWVNVVRAASPGMRATLTKVAMRRLLAVEMSCEQRTGSDWVSPVSRRAVKQTTGATPYATGNPPPLAAPAPTLVILLGRFNIAGSIAASNLVSTWPEFRRRHLVARRGTAAVAGSWSWSHKAVLTAPHGYSTSVAPQRRHRLGSSIICACCRIRYSKPWAKPASATSETSLERMSLAVLRFSNTPTLRASTV